MPQVSDLPPWAMVIFAITLAVIFAVRFWGLWQGERAGPTPAPSTAQVAAVIVDPTALNAATAALVKHTEALAEIGETFETATKNLGYLGTELDRIREELRIQREIRRH